MIKKIVLISFFVTINVVAQNKDEINKSKENEIKSLKEKFQKENALLELKNKEDIQKLNYEIIGLKKCIKETNNFFLKEMFDDTYKDAYFKTRDLSKEDDSENFKLSEALINSIKIEATDEVTTICNKVIDFNKNYLTLLEIRDNVLSKKYNKDKVIEALTKIEKLPEIDKDSKLGNRKKVIYDLLYNYKENICFLKKGLDNLKTKSDQIAIKPLYEKLEKDVRFKDYPYLLQIIIDMKKNATSYTGADDLLPCLEEKESPKEIIQESPKEIKEESPKAIKEEEKKEIKQETK